MDRASVCLALTRDPLLPPSQPLDQTLHQSALRARRLCGYPTMLPHLPSDILHHIFAALPASPGGERARTLRACSLVNPAWREPAQHELPRHIR